MLILKNFFKTIGIHALCSLGCMMFVMMFPGIIDFTICKILYSVLAIMILFDVYFTAAWNMANKEYKSIKIHNNHLAEGEEPLKMKYTEGIILSLIFAVLGIILWAVSFGLSVENSGLSVAAFRIWFCEFLVAFMYSVRHIRHVSFIVAVFPAFPLLIGYFCGVKNYNFVEEFFNRLVYKSKKTNKK